MKTKGFSVPSVTFLGSRLFDSPGVVSVYKMNPDGSKGAFKRNEPGRTYDEILMTKTHRKGK